jgi:hypothetical protein
LQPTWGGLGQHGARSTAIGGKAGRIYSGSLEREIEKKVRTTTTQSDKTISNRSAASPERCETRKRKHEGSSQ